MQSQVVHQLRSLLIKARTKALMKVHLLTYYAAGAQLSTLVEATFMPQVI